MAREISDFSVRLISLVKAGANNKSIIYKDENFSELLRVDFTKSDEEQGIVYGIVYAPDEVDTQGEWANANEIKKAAYDFMKRGEQAYCVDVNHNFNIADAYVCESWIVKSKDEFFDEVGAWAVGIKIEDEHLRELVKNGELNGLSMYGSGVIKEKNISEHIKSALAEFFKKETNKGEKMDKEEIEKAFNEGLDEFKKEIGELKKSLDTKTLELQELKKEFDEIKTTLSKSKQNEEITKTADEKTASWGIL